MTEPVPISREDLRHLFDLAVDTPLVCSGSFDTEDVDLLRRVAVAIGVDPNSPDVTPDEFISQYPHKFVPRKVWAERGTVSEWVSPDGTAHPDLPAHTETRHWRPRMRHESSDETLARIAEERADLTCHAGPGNRSCGRPAADPIHIAS